MATDKGLQVRMPHMALKLSRSNLASSCNFATKHSRQPTSSLSFLFLQNIKFKSQVQVDTESQLELYQHSRLPVYGHDSRHYARAVARIWLNDTSLSSLV